MFSPATTEASMSGLKRPPVCGETPPMKRRDTEGSGPKCVRACVCVCVHNNSVLEQSLIEQHISLLCRNWPNTCFF